MPRVENLYTGVSFYASRDMARDYVGDPLYKVTFSSPQVRVADGKHAETITESKPTHAEYKAARRELIKQRRTERGFRVSPGFNIPVEPRSIGATRALRRGA